MAESEDKNAGVFGKFKTPEAPVEKTPPGIFDEFKNPQEAKVTRAETSFNLAKDADPEAEARRLELAQKSGKSLELVREDEDEIRHQTDKPNLSNAVGENPDTVSFFANPDNAAISKDDFDRLADIEKQYSKYKNRDPLRKYGYGPLLSVGKTALSFGPSLLKFSAESIELLSGAAGSTLRGLKELPGLNRSEVWKRMISSEEYYVEKVNKWAQETAEYHGKYLASDFLNLKEDKQGRLWDNPGLLLDPEWLVLNTGQAATSLGSMYLGGAAGGGIRAMSVMGGLMEAGSLHHELIKEGEDPDKSAASSLAFGGVTMGLNKIGLERLMKELPATGLGARLSHRVVSGATEGLTEFAEEPFQAVAGGLAKEDSASQILQDTIKSLQNVDVIPGAFFAGGAMNVSSSQSQAAEAQRQLQF